MNSFSLIDLINKTEKSVLAINPEIQKNSIELLLQKLLDCDKAHIYLNNEKQLNQKQLNTYNSWVNRLTKNEPIQYITGTTEFYGLTFYTPPSVFIPRPETERVVEESLQLLQSISNPIILDIGTGSGCLAIALAKEKPEATMTAIDVNKHALKTAQINSKMHHLNNVQFMEMNILKETPTDTYDLIVSNPPYIPMFELEKLNQNVKDFEPHRALTDQSDGLTFYQRFSSIASKTLRPNGHFVLEVGKGDHPKKVQKLFPSKIFGHSELIKDYNGDDRVIIIPSV